MDSSFSLRVERAEQYVRLNFLFRLLFGIYFILYLGHIIMLAGYRTAAFVIAAVNWVLALITGRNQSGLTRFLRNYLRFDAQMRMSLLGLVEPIPHIDVNRHNPEFPVQLHVEAPEETSTLYCFLRLSGIIHILLLPHYICLGLLAIAVALAYLVAFFAVLFTGRWPQGIFNLIVGWFRWIYRVQTYWMGLADEYPPFKLAEGGQS